jgi:hypothetical protein
MPLQTGLLIVLPNSCLDIAFMLSISLVRIHYFYYNTQYKVVVPHQADCEGTNYSMHLTRLNENMYA